MGIGTDLIGALRFHPCGLDAVARRGNRTDSLLDSNLGCPAPLRVEVRCTPSGGGRIRASEHFRRHASPCFPYLVSREGSSEHHPGGKGGSRAWNRATVAFQPEAPVPIQAHELTHTAARAWTRNRARGAMNRGYLPHQREPHDVLRQGIPSLKEDALLVHPVEELQEKGFERDKKEYMRSLKDIYGSALPASMEIEEEILDRARRFPGAVTCNIGLEARMGRLDRLASEDFAEMAVRSEIAPPSLHELMERKYGIARGPLSRTMY